MGKETIHIAFTINEAYVKYFVICLTSLLESAGDEELHIYVINDDITEYSKRRILELQHIKNFVIDFVFVSPPMLKDIKPPTRSDIHMNTSYRLLSASLMRNLEKVIFLDADLLPIKSLKELWTLNMHDYYMACVIDPVASDQYYGDWIQRLELPNKYVNTGVCVFNLSKWRQDNIEEKIFALCDVYYDKLKFPEQDLLNIACSEKIKYLPLAWNAAPLLLYTFPDEKKEALSDPYIIHYAGERKPWTYPDAPYADLFWKYARKTSYYEELLYNCKKMQQTIDDIYWLMHEIRLKRTYYRRFIKYKLLAILTFGLVKKYKIKRNENRQKLKYLKKRFAW
jgi:lipopolysaccharide biosynthesis glycosyltransferase